MPSILFCLKPKAFLNWSSGKDSALALFIALSEEEYAINSLVTTVNVQADRVSMHGLRRALLHKQAEAIGLPLKEIVLPEDISMETYTETIAQEFRKFLKAGYSHTIYGDIFLEDLREYREKTLRNIGLQGVYPLWKKDTSKLAKQIIALGFKAVTVAVSDKALGKEYCGRAYDQDFLNNLPAGVDPCGENGEFHTFVHDGPIFKKPVSFELGKIIKRDLSTSTDKNKSWESIFWFCDLI
ncbi:diphthine--ammonia ligase [Flavimarina sp. Hel_I_48]|uniref:Dph6-related ATP pyrophosphatase n=1 Tax=Flavimarina sp. Hel_I_48 TaxID=1392488 RepID=UPI001F13C950|nr:diphthine--ammonia ligase [Flavimarina sp. Hel_I_48]